MHALIAMGKGPRTIYVQLALTPHKEMVSEAAERNTVHIVSACMMITDKALPLQVIGPKQKARRMQLQRS
jgi:hypothetical protein